MVEFYINLKTYEIHKQTCKQLKHPSSNTRPLGTFDSLSHATVAAKSLGYKKADGCLYCCNSYNIN